MKKETRNKYLKIYKGIILPKIHDAIVKEKNIISIGKVDELLKEYSGFRKNESCSNMSNDDLLELITHSQIYGDNYGLNLNWDDNECDFIRDL